MKDVIIIEKIVRDGKKSDKYDSEFYRVATCIDNYLERERQQEYEAQLQKEKEKSKRAEEHSKCNTKIVMSIVTTIGRRGRPEIEVKINDLINEIGYVRKYETIEEMIAYMPAIIKKYKVGQIQCEVDGFGIGIYDGLKNARLGVDIVPLKYMVLKL